MGVYSRAGVVLGGLVLYLDAANKKSYPGSGTTWFDMSGNRYTGTLNGVDYDPSNQNSFTWNNLTDNVTFGSSLGLTYTNATVCFWMKTTDTKFVVFSRFNNPYLGAVLTGNGYWYHLGVGAPTTYTNGILSDRPNYNNVWAHYTFTNCDFTANSNWNLSGTTLFYYSGWEFETGSVATFSIYNRSLSQAEILQNYNAQKARFGL